MSASAFMSVAAFHSSSIIYIYAVLGVTVSWKAGLMYCQLPVLCTEAVYAGFPKWSQHCPGSHFVFSATLFVEKMNSCWILRYSESDRHDNWHLLIQGNLLSYKEWVNNCWWGWQNRTVLEKWTYLYDNAQGTIIVLCVLYMWVHFFTAVLLPRINFWSRAQSYVLVVVQLAPFCHIIC